jgi:glycosyltransferase involved in cell wall biosynthesis
VKILQVHNYYQQRGGEDEVYAAECELLRQHGHTVEQFAVHNDALKNVSPVRMARDTVWNPESHRAIAARLAEFRPDILHCHNTFPIVSPAAYYAAAKARVPVVQTVPNYRLICPAATLTRQGRICEDCMGKAIPYPGVLHACYRHNRLATAAVASLLTVHRALGTWRRNVSVYLVPTAFLKEKLVAGGFDASQIEVKPNFLPYDPGEGSGDGGYALFAGRLATEKGLGTLLEAWKLIPELPLQIAGDGPLRERIEAQAKNLPNVTVLGFQNREQLLGRMKRAALLVVPSEWYEGFPMTVVEAMACGTPVVASDLGSLREIVVDGVTGTRFAPGDARALEQAVSKIVECGLPGLRRSVRERFLTLYSAEVNYEQLVAVYRKVLAPRY